MGESQLEALMSRGRRHSAQEALDHALSRVPKTSPASNGHVYATADRDGYGSSGPGRRARRAVVHEWVARG